MDLKKLLAITFMAASLTATAFEPSKVKEYEQYAKDGESWAAASLARAYANGDGLEKNYQKAHKYYEIVCQIGTPVEKAEAAIFEIRSKFNSYRVEAAKKLLEELAQTYGAPMCRQIALKATLANKVELSRQYRKLQEVYTCNFAPSFYGDCKTNNTELVDTFLRHTAKPFARLNDGRVVHYAQRVLDKAPDRIENGQVVNGDPAISYAVIDYPGEGTFYGFVEQYKTIPEGNYRLLRGRMVNISGDTTVVFLKTPAQWRKTAKQVPSGAYTCVASEEDKVVGFDYENQEEMVLHGLIVGLNFTPAGGVTYSYGSEYTDYAWMESKEGSGGTNMKTGRRRRKGGQITGGWYFDVDAKAKLSGRWTLTDRTLNLDLKGSPTVTVNTKFNEKAMIDHWKREAAEDFTEFKMGSYERQFLAQARGDYPTSQFVKRRKKMLREMLTEVIPAPQLKQTYKILGVTANDLYLSKNGSVLHFEKKRGTGETFNNERFKEAVSEYIHNIPSGRRIWLSQVADSAAVKISSVLDDTFDEVIDDWCVSRPVADSDLCEISVITHEPVGDYHLHKGQIKFDNNGLPDLEAMTASLKIDPTLSELVNQTRELDNQLLLASKKSKDKNIKKSASEYLKRNKGKHISAAVVSLRGYEFTVNALRERISAQRQALGL